MQVVTEIHVADRRERERGGGGRERMGVYRGVLNFYEIKFKSYTV